MAIKVQGTTIIDDSRNIVNGIGASFTGIVTASTSIVGAAVTIDSTGINVTGVVTATSSIVGAAVTINSTGINVTGVVTATSFEGDGSALSGTGFTQDADGNLFAGTNAGGGYDPDTGTSLYNIFLGEDSGAAIANGDHNVFLGYQAGCSVTTGIHNIIFGCRSGCSLQTGSCNVFLGQCAASAATGSSNFVSGHEAGKCMTSGSGNILLTQGSSVDNGAAWTGSNTVAIGKQAGRRLCGSSSNNVFLGKYAGLCVTTGGSNVFIGDEAGCGTNAKTGSNNVVLGKSAGTNLSSANHNFFGGYKAGCATTTGACNIFLGNGAGKCVTTGSCNIFLGVNAASTTPAKTGSNNIMLGANTGQCLQGGGNNSFLGAGAGQYIRGSYNIGIGDCAGRGSQASSDGGCNVSIGKLAGGQLRSGADNVLLGRCAAYANYNGNDRVAIGCGSGYTTSNGDYTVFIGKGTGYYSRGYYNVAIGCGALTGCSTSSDGACNVVIGLLSGRCIHTGNHNVFLGTCAGTDTSHGCSNVFLGAFAGNTNTSGDCNIAIGYDVELPSATGDNQMAIGSGTTSWIAGDSSYNVTLTGAPGTGIVTAYTGGGVHVSGVVTATSSVVGAAVTIDSTGINVTGVVTATSSIVGAAVTINSTGINVTGVVTATSFEGDGSALTGISAGGGSGEFNTGITSSIQITPLSYESTVHTFPSTSGSQFVIESISVANVDESVGVGTTVNIIASIEDATAAEQTYIAYNVPITTGGLIELLKNPIVAGPSDVIKMWTTNESYVGTSNAADVYLTYSEFTDSTDYISKFASTTTINTTDSTTIYTSTSNPTTIEKIGFANRTDTGDYPISIKITNGTSTTYLAKNLIIPRYSTVDILDRAKRIETGATIDVEVGSTSTIDVIIAGKKITS